MVVEKTKYLLFTNGKCQINYSFITSNHFILFIFRNLKNITFGELVQEQFYQLSINICRIYKNLLGR